MKLTQKLLRWKHRRLNLFCARFLLLCLVFFCLLPATHAQQSPGLYLSPGRVLQAEKPRRISTNAPVTSFLFQPGSLSIAYVGTHEEDHRRTVTVWFADARRHDPTITTLFQVTGDASDATVPDAAVPDVHLLGWTPDARYLLLQQQNDNTLKAQYFSVDMAAVPFHVRPIPAPEQTEKTPIDIFALSPNHRQLLTVSKPDYVGPDKPPSVAGIYDPVRDEVHPVTLAVGVSVWGWLDEGHLLLLHSPSEPNEGLSYLSRDLATGTDTVITRPTPWPPASGSRVSYWHLVAEPVPPAAPDLTLETQPQTLTDAQKVAQTPATVLWVRRAKAPKALSAIAVGVTPGEDDPQAAWSSAGNAVAYLAHEDLFVCDLMERDATPTEKWAAGETLTCADKQQIVMSHMKEIGLGILQYTQDHDEKFPPADGWHDAVFPYVKEESDFSFMGVPVIYYAPASPNLAAMDNPEKTVIAMSDLPCARIALYADGHVQAYPKEGGAE